MYSREEIEAEKKRRANSKVKNINSQMEQSSESPDMPFPEHQEHPFMSGVTGFNTAIERPVQGLMQLFTGDNWKALQETAKKREADYGRSSATNPGSTMFGDILGNVGLGAATGGGFSALAGKLAPVAKSSPYLKNILAGMLGGGALGGAQYVEPNESRLENTLEGAGIGGGISAVIPGLGRAIPMIGRGISRAVGNTNRIMEDFLKKFTPDEMRLALEKNVASQRLGTKLTPSEAGENKIASKLEGKLGTSEEGERSLYEFKKSQKDLEDEAIQKMIASINPNPENAYEQIRNSAKKIITKKEKALQNRARPHYEAAENMEISPNKLNSLTKDGNINKYYKEVLNDEAYQSEIEGFAPNSIKVLDEVKKRLDGAIGAATRSGDKNLARILRNSKEKLVTGLDDISSDYAKARGIYSSDSPLIDMVRKRQIGKIAKLNDDQIKQVGNVIFDAGELDNNALKRMATEFNKENPEAWSRIIRNYMENKLATNYVGRTGYHGTNFYNQFLANDKIYNKLHTALEHNPSAQQALKDMRLVFKDTINQPTIKGTAARSASHVDISRNWLGETKKFFENATGGHYDKAMVDIITTDKWSKAFEKALNAPTKEAKTENVIKLLDHITNIGGKAAASKGTATKGPFMETEHYEFYD
jgi:hypothetical protein